MQLPAVSAEGVSKVTLTSLLTLLGTVAFIMAAFTVARATGLSVLCYDGLQTQAATTATVILPLSVYSILLASKSSLRRVALVGAVVASVYGVLLAASV